KSYRCSAQPLDGRLGLDRAWSARRSAVPRGRAQRAGKGEILAGQGRAKRAGRRSGRGSALWRPAPAGNRPRHVHGTHAAVPRRARGRAQSARIGRSQALLEIPAGRARHLVAVDRARHVGGDGDFRSHRGARIRPEDFRRPTRSRAQRPEGDRLLSRCRRRGGRRGGSGDLAMSEPLLSVRDVKSFYGNIMALKGVAIDVAQGEIVTLIGANGAGKSTLMMTIFGNPRAREGRIIYEGRDITRLPTHA